MKPRAITVVAKRMPAITTGILVEKPYPEVGPIIDKIT